MKKTMLICTMLIATMLVGLAGCGKNDGAKSSEATSAIEELRDAEMQLAGELYKNETILAFQGNSGALNSLDCSGYAEKMEEYDDVLKYTNLFEWMVSENLVDDIDSYDKDSMTISDEDYEAVIKSFYQLDKENQSKVLRHMFLDTGANETRTVDFDYVPTGEVTEDGLDITKYQVTNEREISVRIYANNPLEIEVKE